MLARAASVHPGPLDDMHESKGILCVESPRNVIPNLHVLWSSGTIWQGIRAEAYHVEAVETAPFQTVDHSVILHLSTPALVEIEIDGQRDIRKRVPGDLTILPGASIRKLRSHDPHDVLMVAMSQELMAQAAWEAGCTTPFELIARAYQRDAQLEHIFWALKAEAEHDFVSGPLYGKSLGLAVCAHLLRQGFAMHKSAARKGGMAPRVLRQVMDYIDSNLDSPLRMASLAEVCGLSQYRFAHNFKSATGVPPYQYVIRRRLDRAKLMLRQTNLSVLDIANAVGCQSISRFNSLFRQEMGITPSSYRASFR